MAKRTFIGLMAMVLFFALVFVATSSLAGTTELVSVDSYGNPGNNACEHLSSISADGRYVAFASYATNLVPGDTNGVNDIFVHDRQTGITERVSVDSYGNQSNNGSLWLAISANGRYVAFTSWANNLVAGDTNGGPDIFVHDRQTRVTERVSVDSIGNQANPESASPAMSYPSISADGRYVAFVSGATNLMPDDTNGVNDIFVHDRQAGITERVSVDSSGNQANNHSSRVFISAGGRYVAFASSATNLVPEYFGGVNIFVHDLQTGITELVSKNANGESSNGGSFPVNLSISTDGRYVAFDSLASNLILGDADYYTQWAMDTWDVFVYDRQASEITRISDINTYSSSPSISADGRYVAFVSYFQVFAHDRQTGITELVSVDSSGNLIGGGYWPSISADGRYVAFASDGNLVQEDTNPSRDIYVRDRGPSLPKTIDGAIIVIEELLGMGEITNAGIATNLTSTLENALKAQEQSNIYAAKNILLAFINKVEAQTGKNITEESATFLIEAARQLMDKM